MFKLTLYLQAGYPEHQQQRADVPPPAELRPRPAPAVQLVGRGTSQQQVNTGLSLVNML